MTCRYYVGIMSFVDFDALEPGCKVLLHSKTNSVVGLLSDDTDPMVSVMKVDKAPTETYADIGGLDKQVQEMKVRRWWTCVWGGGEASCCHRWRGEGVFVKHGLKGGKGRGEGFSEQVS